MHFKKNSEQMLTLIGRRNNWNKLEFHLLDLGIQNPKQIQYKININKMVAFW